MAHVIMMLTCSGCRDFFVLLFLDILCLTFWNYTLHPEYEALDVISQFETLSDCIIWPIIPSCQFWLAKGAASSFLIGSTCHRCGIWQNMVAFRDVCHATSALSNRWSFDTTTDDPLRSPLELSWQMCTPEVQKHKRCRKSDHKGQIWWLAFL